MCFHRWKKIPGSMASIRRNVIAIRACGKCGKGQIKKSIYTSFLNPKGWVDNGVNYIFNKDESITKEEVMLNG